MNAKKQITDILTACGCKPTTTTDNGGNVAIKVNAPTVAPFRYHVIKTWADASRITDTLTYKKIPFASHVLSWTQVIIEVNAENLPDAETICDGWKEGPI